MMKRKKTSQIWVDDEFKFYLKEQAAKEKMKLVDYTRKVAKKTKKDTEGFSFDF